MWESENQKLIAVVYTREEKKSNITLYVSYVFLISSLLIYFEISSEVTKYVKEYSASLLTHEAVFLFIELLGRFLYFLITFSVGLEILEVLQIQCWSTLIPRFGTMFIKKLSELLVFLYSFLINGSFSFRVVCTFDLTLLEKSGFTLPQNFLLSLNLFRGEQKGPGYQFLLCNFYKRKN